MDISERRSLRTRNSSSVSGAATGTPAGSESGSPRSDVSEGRASRSSRLSNPEFAAKHKAFMAKVTAASKGSMDSYLNTEILVDESLTPGGKRKAKVGDDLSAKRRRNTKQNSNGLDTLNDAYCWICHKEGSVICCETCPRVFHLKCIQLETSPAEDWVCPECVLIMTAENMDTRSRAMRLLTVDQLCTLLKHALARMKSVPNSEPFLKPVDPLQFPAYKDYISCPMDIQSMERNIRRKQYGSTEAMLADCKWILHNCIIFNSPASKLTSIAKNIVKVCKHEMQEIENCPDCYLNAHIKKDTWFTEACRFPHPLVWAKLKGFPYWPGKIMRVNSDNNADIRFFGAHDRAWIALKDVFLYSERPPLDIKKKRGNIDDCFNEVQTHIKKLKDRFGEFHYAEHKTHYDHSREEDMLKTLYPKFTLPFEIGYLARRARSYSFTASERSHAGTPTPSETSVMEEEDPEEVEDGVEMKLDELFQPVEKPSAGTATADPNVFTDVQDNRGQSEDDKFVQDVGLNVTESDNVPDIEESQNDIVIETYDQEEVNESTVPENQEKHNIEMKEDEEVSDERTNIAENSVVNETIEEVAKVATKENESSITVAEKIIDDSIEKSVEEVEESTTTGTVEENDQEEENKSAIEQLPKSFVSEEILEDMKTTTSSLVAEKLCLEDKIESSQNLHTDTETQTNRSSISPPCEVSSTTATPGPGTQESQESQDEGKAEEVIKDNRIRGVIADTLEPVVIEDEDPSDEIDDVEPANQSEEEMNDVMEIEDDEVVESENVTETPAEKQPGETSRAGNQTVPEKDEIDDVEPSSDPKSSKKDESKTTVDPKLLLAAGVSITVIDKKNKTGEDSATSAAAATPCSNPEVDDSSDISVTLVQKNKTDTSSGKFTLR